MSEATFYVWKKKYSGLALNELRELRQLREEANEAPRELDQILERARE